VEYGVMNMRSYAGNSIIVRRIEAAEAKTTSCIGRDMLEVKPLVVL